jgi:transposase-like protein
VEVDQTCFGHDQTVKPKGEKKGRGYAHKHKVLSLRDRGTRRARSMVVDDLKATTLVPILRENIEREARVTTDEAGYYVRLDAEFAEHAVVHHGRDEYVRGDIHTNTLESYFSIFKRRMKGAISTAASGISVLSRSLIFVTTSARRSVMATTSVQWKCLEM